jgi:GT2 family glycosyltransferase
MNCRSSCFSIIIPTKNRREILAQLLDSISRLKELNRIRPEIIVADNGSDDGTYDYVNSISADFPATLRALTIPRGGKSAAVNEAAKAATGNILAFLDDDVVVDGTWLTAVEEIFREGKYRIGQGIIRLQSPAIDDPEVQRLIQRYRTIPKLEYDANLTEVRSLNGSNFFLCRELFDHIGGFDERLGPGASGTSEDVDFARRLIHAGIEIGYAPKAVVYHRVDRSRLTDEYFKQSHWRQGKSRFLLRNRSIAAILFDLTQAFTRYAYYTLIGQERHRYRSKGRIYHYLGMMDAKRNNNDRQRAR